MFEVNKDANIILITDIGPDKRRAIIVDDFYLNPDEVRDYCLSNELITKDKNSTLLGGLAGSRVYCEDDRVRTNLKTFFDDVCFDTNIWGKKKNLDSYEESWKKAGFMCNVVNDSTLIDKPEAAIPHQDSYSEGIQFGCVIYLNTKDECSGGTGFYSFNNMMCLNESDECGIPVPQNVNMMSKEEIYNYIKLNVESGDRWRIEHLVDMKYNRMLLYESNILHCPYVELGKFKDFNRINQVLFL